MPGNKFQTEQSFTQPYIFQKHLTVICGQAAIKTFNYCSLAVLKLNTILCHKNLWSLADISFSLLERHVLPHPNASHSNKSSIGLYQNEKQNMIWLLNSSTGLETRKGGQHACSSAQNLLLKFACEGDLSCWGRSLGSNVARNSRHPSQTSSDVHCQVDKLISEERSTLQ